MRLTRRNARSPNQIYQPRPKMESRNLEVLARDPDSGFYYPGFATGPVKKIPGQPDSQNVLFGNTEQTVPVSEILNVGGSSPWPKLQIGNPVFVPRINADGREIYVPGNILKLPINSLREHRFYTVGLYNGKKIKMPRRQIMKVGQQRYNDVIKDVDHNSQPKFIWKRNPKQISIELIDNSSQTDNRPAIVVLSTSSQTVETDGPRTDSQPGTTPVSETDGSTTDSQPGTTPVSETDGSTTDSQPPTMPVRRPPDLGSGQEVLARWPDDGWFYFGVVESKVEGQDLYKVRDSTGHVIRIKRDDLLLEEENSFQPVQPSDCVVALHPNYTYSYAPATIEMVFYFGAQVVFYDNCVRKLKWSELFKISNDKYHQSVEYIKKCKEKLCKQEAVVLDESCGCYTPKTIDTVTGAQEYCIKGHGKGEGQTVEMKQKAIHVFPLSERGMQSRDDEHCKFVLAPTDNTGMMYHLPAEVTVCSQTKNDATDGMEKTYNLNLCDGSVLNVTSLDKCFYLSQDYYNFAIRFYKSTF